MRKARSEEYWEYIGTISIFGTPKATISASVFGAKKHFFRPPLFRNPFSKSPKNEKTPAICPFIGNPILHPHFRHKNIASQPYQGETPPRLPIFPSKHP